MFPQCNIKMLPLTVRAVCLNLLSCAYLAESFVLLTANVEDIKHIAKKFLSESLSEQISEFISKAKLQDAISEENERNAQDDKNSRERENLDATESYRLVETYNYQPNNVNERFDPYNEARKGNEGFKPDNRVHDNRVHDNREPENSIHDERQQLKIEAAYVKPHDFDEYNKNMEENRYQAKPKSIPRMGLASSHHKIYKKIKLTTEKQRNNEFDQYDNTNYERNELIATSGQLVLPRVKGLNNRKSKN